MSELLVKKPFAVTSPISAAILTSLAVKSLSRVTFPSRERRFSRVTVSVSSVVAWKSTSPRASTSRLPPFTEGATMVMPPRVSRALVSERVTPSPATKARFPGFWN